MSAAASPMPKLTSEQRRAAAGQFERANQVLKAGDHDYGLQLLLECCKIDPANLIYRQTLRQAQRSKYQNNEKGQSLAYVRSFMTRLSLQKSMVRGDFRAALLHAEAILMRNPWDLATHLVMAKAFEELGWPDHALWTLEQIRRLHPKNPKVNKPLARLYEQRGNFNQAIALWEIVRSADPNDHDAARKAKDLSASATIAKGKYAEAIKGDASASPALSRSDASLPALADDGNSQAVSQAHDDTATDQPALGRTDAGPLVDGKDRQPREVAGALQRIKQNPKNANGYLQLAGVYRKAEQYDKAKAILQQGCLETNNHFEITQELFDLDIEPFRRDLAVTEERLRQAPADTELPTIRDRMTKEINTRELEYYRRRSDRFPTDTAARFEMGLRLLRAGQVDEAIKELQTIRNDPRFHGKALFYLGLCFQTRKNWRLAQRNLEEALQHLGTGDDLRKETMYLLAVGYANAGEMERAIDLGCELANLEFNYKDIGTLLDDWQTKVVK